jgi:hypothetical protein
MCSQSSTHQSFDDPCVEHVNRAISRKMPNSIMLGGRFPLAQSGMDTAFRACKGTPSATPHRPPTCLRATELCSRVLAVRSTNLFCRSFNTSQFLPLTIKRILRRWGEKAELGWRGLNFVVTGSQEQREGAKPDPEHPDSGAQKDSRVLIPAARVITLKTEIRA